MKDLDLEPDLQEFARICQPLKIPSPECADDKYYLINPSYKQVDTARRGLLKFIKEHPDEKTLIFYLLAGHGGHSSGKQAMILNEYRKQSSWHKLFGAEAMIRSLAQSFP